MKAGEIRTLAGPNVYSHMPVLTMVLYLEDLTGRLSVELPGFCERLLESLPGLQEHRCDAGRPGGFVERLYAGTDFGHIVEHTTLELTRETAIPSFYGKTQPSGIPGSVLVLVGYKAEQGARYLLRTAVEMVESLARGEAFPLKQRIEEAKRIVARTELGPSTRAIVEAAERRGIPWTRLGQGSLVQFGYGKHRRFVEAAISDQTRAVAVDVAGDKQLTKILLERAAIPVPRGRSVCTEEEALAALAELGAPVVVKPRDGCQGKGVSLNLRTPAEVLEAFQFATKISPDILVEELFEGQNYRVLVVDGKVVAASERVPASVTGDGQHTVAELIEVINQDPLRGEGHESPLTRIAVDAVLLAHLKKCGLTLGHVPPKGERLLLREGANLSTGGTARDVTESVHPDVLRLCERTAAVIGLDVCGIDLVLKNISSPLSQGGVIEVNASPGLRMHQFPTEGRGRDVGKVIVDGLYPSGSPFRIPILSVTGTNGKTTCARMIAHTLAVTGKAVGVTTSDGIWVGGECIRRCDATGFGPAQTVLSDPSVEVAVLETAGGGIVRDGLAYDWSDVSVITNIQSDHFGENGATTLEDLVYIKSLVAERVRINGTLILNADDEPLARLMEAPRVRKLEKKVVYFSLNANSPFLRRHLAGGGTGYFLKNEWVVEAMGQIEQRIVPVTELSVTLNGTAQFQIANIMAAVSACRAYGVGRKEVASSLMGFRSDWHNPGRANLYEISGSNVLVDCGRNPDAFRAICRMSSCWKAPRTTAIIGVPGDRSNELIEQVGRVAARCFDRLLIKEDKELRGRKMGEVATLLYWGVKGEVRHRECLIVPDECEALLRALEDRESGEVIAVFCENFEPILELLKRHGAVAASTTEGQIPQLRLANV
jgi:cyanophycin synthetase